MAVTGEHSWTQLGSTLAGLMFVAAIIQRYLPFDLRRYFDYYVEKLLSYFNPHIHIKFHEYSGGGFKRNEAYSVIGRYLSATSSSRASRLKGDIIKGSAHSVILSMDEQEEVPDVFQGVTLRWASHKVVPDNQTISLYPGGAGERRYYKLSFHRRHRETVTGEYLNHVVAEGKAISLKNRTRKLFTNNRSDENWYGYEKEAWSHVPFDHPATFETIAMEPKAKAEIIKDLMTFSRSKEYYKKIGRTWKRGYLLYGPPGTGKSSMIAAMANLLSYDVYDLQLTAVNDNTELRRLLAETTNKSIIVIEDVDCSVDLTGQRKSSRDEEEDENGEKDVDKEAKENPVKDDSNPKDKSKVTLSGLLNFVDGLWSACGGERIIIFTTNCVEKLDPALIRRGRMDRHIEMSYCGFEAFKVLARNYLDVESHRLFPAIEALLGEVKMTPADVAEGLMRKCGDEDATARLENLITELEMMAKDESKKKSAEQEEEAEEGLMTAGAAAGELENGNIAAPGVGCEGDAGEEGFSETNCIEKLDPKPIIRGGMPERPVEMLYCGFEEFKVLARDVLDVWRHELFPEIEALLREVKMTPADVEEFLAPKCRHDRVRDCLWNLVAELKAAKEEEAEGKKKGTSRYRNRVICSCRRE